MTRLIFSQTISPYFQLFTYSKGLDICSFTNYSQSYKRNIPRFVFWNPSKFFFLIFQVPSKSSRSEGAYLVPDRARIRDQGPGRSKYLQICRLSSQPRQTGTGDRVSDLILSGKWNNPIFQLYSCYKHYVSPCKTWIRSPGTWFSYLFTERASIYRFAVFYLVEPSCLMIILSRVIQLIIAILFIFVNRQRIEYKRWNPVKLKSPEKDKCFEHLKYL